MRTLVLLALCAAIPTQVHAFSSTSINRSRVQKKKVGFITDTGVPVGQPAQAASAPVSAGGNTLPQTQLPPGSLPQGAVIPGPGSGSGSGGGLPSSAGGGGGFGLGNGSTGFGSFSGGSKPTAKTTTCAQGQTLVGSQCVGAVGINSLPGSGASAGGNSGTATSLPSGLPSGFSSGGGAVAPPAGVPTR